MSLGRAPVVVGAGGGLLGGSPRAVRALLADVADALGGEVGASRALVDAGWFGPERLVGASGVTIAPVLYLGFGVAGTTYHEIGDPVHVIAVNTDPAAPLLARATLPLCTDAAALLAELAPRLRGTRRGIRADVRSPDVRSPDVRRSRGTVTERLRAVTGVPIGPVRAVPPASAAQAASAVLAYLEECCG
ncbi:FAD-binding protein [Cryptosporangium japonicum]|uniref:Electron transfer flavoprotein alpha subunit C-terminal domain-containing protein n=1 Tax=Cryptosporangium japonicum TaxID=80872 RepID=A0ABP3E1M6_9ACTN